MQSTEQPGINFMSQMDRVFSRVGTLLTKPVAKSAAIAGSDQSHIVRLQKRLGQALGIKPGGYAPGILPAHRVGVLAADTTSAGFVILELWTTPLNHLVIVSQAREHFIGRVSPVTPF